MNIPTPMITATMIMGEDIGLPNTNLLRLFQLVSPALPIGAFAYSQGLEAAIELKLLLSGDDVSNWLNGIIEDCMANLEVPVFARLYRAWAANNAEQVLYWNALLLASRGAAEIRAEDMHLGKALLRVLATLGVVPPASLPLAEMTSVSYASAFALACVHWQIPLATGAAAFVFAATESQVSAAVRLVPLGQSQGQAILAGLAASIQQAVRRGLEVRDEDIGAGAPGHVMACALHETQYSRLFRS